MRTSSAAWVGEAYTAGWLGCEWLARFWLAMATLRDWKKAFAEAFGVALEAFYS